MSQNKQELSGFDWNKYLPVVISLVLLIFVISLDYFSPEFPEYRERVFLYLLAYIPVGWPVALKGVKLALRGDVFTEFFLMTIATLGAFLIGEYPEAVAVMLFYTIGEHFQHAAVVRARRNINALLDARPDRATVIRESSTVEVDAVTVNPGTRILVRAGEKVPLDGSLISENGIFNAAALTGEIAPINRTQGEMALAGMINQGDPVELVTERPYADSSIAKMLQVVEEAARNKAKTEQFIRRFSRIYTPIVVFFAIALVALPALIVSEYRFEDWLYRALIFLVLSCPCALVISIPLGYFGGIGAASRHGILFKGSNFLDLIPQVSAVFMDKTGTLTRGVFKVQRAVPVRKEPEQWLSYASALESLSTHPVAKAVVEYTNASTTQFKVEQVVEHPGMGMTGLVSGKKVVVGNVQLLMQEGVNIEVDIESEGKTLILVGIDGLLAGYLIIADEIRADSKHTIAELKRRGIETIILSGDRQSVVDTVKEELEVVEAIGALLPEDKIQYVRQYKEKSGGLVAFMGDGLNDAGALAIADVGIAMGGLGTDLAIESADVIIRTDQPSGLLQAMDIGIATKKVVWQNITMAFAVKAIVLIMGAGGIATMWEAVFADVGVALLAILNATRIQKKQF